ncbi:hypothetical protein TSMEX_010748 [Taenia solium]|eukprot:TsM_000025900 transcript=TsM_000025900 gene=TsM_000025900
MMIMSGLISQNSLRLRHRASADYEMLFGLLTGSSHYQQHPSLPTVAMARANVDVDADPWESTGTELSASGFVVVVVVVDSCGIAIIQPIGPAVSSLLCVDYRSA